MPSAIPLDSVAAPSPPSSPPSSRRSGSRLSLRNGALAWFIAGWWFLPAGIIQEIWLWALLLPSLWFCRDDALRQLRPGGVALPTAGFLFSLLGLSAATGHLSSPDDLIRALRDEHTVRLDATRAAMADLAVRLPGTCVLPLPTVLATAPADIVAALATAINQLRGELGAST